METLKEHVKLMTQMYDKELSMKNIKRFKINELYNCCKKIENSNISNKIYKNLEFIQSEMIKDTNSIDYLIKLYKAGINSSKIEDLIKTIEKYKDKLVNYNIFEIIEVLKDERLYSDIGYAYLRYFCRKIKSNIGKNTVINNLKYFFLQEDVKIGDLTAEQLGLFTSPFLNDYNLIPRDNLKRVYELLVQNTKLKKFIHFLYLNKLRVPLKIEHYEKISREISMISEYMYSISKNLDNDVMYKFLLRWVENNCNIYDLKFIKNNIDNVKKEDIENIFYNRSGYINFIFKSKVSNSIMNFINRDKEDLIIYAISNNKKAFLKLIEENKEMFLKIPSISILYDKNFYSKYVNLNSLTSKDLLDLQFMKKISNHINKLQEGTYTFNEIKTLYDLTNEVYYKIYNCLLDLKIDDRILRIKQIKNQKLINSYLSDEQIYDLCEKLKVKSLYNWIEQDFAHIQGLLPNDALNILINYDYIKRFIPEIKQKNELLYLLRNKEKIVKFKHLQGIKDSIENIDSSWNKLIEVLELSEKFINKNIKNIKEFLLNNGAEIALTYYRQLQSNSQRKSYKLIVKSELMGEFTKLKYYTNDLDKEINYELKQYQIDEWTKNNIRIQDGNIEVKEYDDFYHTMILGVEPMHTCLSYINGTYNRCLLACFDSNKKILYARIDGQIVARAMIRLTKGTYKNIKSSQTLEFVDLENLENLENVEDVVNTKKSTNERLTIFLEKAYIYGISDKLKQKIEKMFIKVVENKANKMNAVLVLSDYYSKQVIENYISTRYYMYISKSKAGSQYLDSLNGQASVSDEGQYKANNFLIWKTSEQSI